MRIGAAFALLAAAAGALAACSSWSENPPTAFPSVHDMPAPRAEAPMTPDEVKQATDTLISERDRLGAQQAAAAAAANAPATTGSTKTKSAAAKAAAAKTAAAKAVAAKSAGATKTAGADKPQ